MVYRSSAGRARSKDAARRTPGRAAPRPPAAREPRRVLSVDARPYSPQVAHDLKVPLQLVISLKKYIILAHIRQVKCHFNNLLKN